jgi:hypothetical protein
MNISKALFSKYKGCEWSMNNEDYSTLQWFSTDIPKPTEEELVEECERLQTEYEYNQYQRDRASAYPSIQDQLDTLYHQGYDGWKEMIGEVKNKYPKP